tara:strand:- start:54 stop:338 length:285 start_codon:yes stop_codon:yes gene_type:complete
MLSLNGYFILTTMMGITRMNQISAPLRLVCPNCISPLPARPWRRFSGWRGILLASCIRLFIGADGFQLEITSLVTLKMGLAKAQTILMDIYNAI